ncbi:MAG TPA: helix-turn-helix domain-containing protein [Longimicrobiales bacterium]
MSVVVSAWVWKFAPVKSGELVVLLALADQAHDDGGGAYPSQEYLAEKSRMTERQVRNCLSALEQKGLIRKQGRTAKGIVVWQIVMDPERTPGNMFRAETDSQGGGNPLPTEPSVEPSESHSAGAGALVPVPASRRPMTVDRQRVPDEIRDRAAAVLDYYNEKTGRKLGALTARGRPSEALKRIVMRLLDRPDLQVDDVTRVVDNVLANPPSWCEGAVPEVGDIFGPKAFERALNNTGQKTPKKAEDQARENLKARADAAWQRLMGGGA